MTTIAERFDSARTPAPAAFHLRRHTTAAGVCLLLTIVCGVFGELYVPGRLIVPNDPATTARNILHSETLFRLGFAAYLVEALCDVTLCWLYYVLLRPVHPRLALLAMLFGLVSMALYAVGEIFYFASLVTLRNGSRMAGFSPDQVVSLALLWTRIFTTTTGIFMALYGFASLIRGWLLWRSGFVPRVLGLSLATGGAGFVVKNATAVLAPAYSSGLLLLPTLLATIGLGAWLLLRGIDETRWLASGGGNGEI